MEDVMATNDTEQQIQQAEKDLSLTRGERDYAEAVRHHAMKRVEAYGMLAGAADEEWTELAAAAHDVVQRLTIKARSQHERLQDLREERAREIRQAADRAARAVERGTLEEQPQQPETACYGTPRATTPNRVRIDVRDR